MEIVIIISLLCFIAWMVVGQDRPTQPPSNPEPSASSAPSAELAISADDGLKKQSGILIQQNRRLLGERDGYNQTIRRLRAYADIAPDPAPQGSPELLRRSYHALRILHDFRLCRLKGCEYCALGNDILVTIGATRIMEQTTVSRRDMSPEERERGLSGYLARSRRS